MTRVKSLAFNLRDGVDVRRHRTHRSKKGRNIYGRANSEKFFFYKEKKFKLMNQIDEESCII